MIDRLIESFPHLITIGILAVASALISAGETALFALTRQQLAQLRGVPGLAARTILQLRDDSAALLSTIILSNTTINIILYSMLAVTTARLSGGSATLSTLFGVTGFLLAVLVIEIIPKLLAFVAAAHLAPIAAIPLRILQWLTFPARWLCENLIVEPLARIVSPHAPSAPNLDAEELRKLITLSREQGVIDDREKTMLQQLMDLRGARVAHLMIPRVDVVAFNLADDREELTDLIRKHRLLRVPVYEDTIDKVRGVILAREFLLNPERSIEELIRPVLFIPEQASVDALVELLRNHQTQLSLVVDEYGGLAGVVAMEDVVEEIVGELYAPDELYPMPPLSRIDDRTYQIDADLDLDDFRRAFELPVEETRFNTVGGLIAAELNRVPARGDEVTLGEAKLVVLSMRRKRMLQVKLVLPAPPKDNPDLQRLLATPAHTNTALSIRSAS